MDSWDDCISIERLYRTEIGRCDEKTVGSGNFDATRYRLHPIAESPDQSDGRLQQARLEPSERQI
jgi:hypothetical protein